MEVLKQTVLNICFASVIGGLFHLLAPSGTYKRTVRMIVALFMLAMVLQPFSGEYDFSQLFQYEWQAFAPSDTFSEQTMKTMEEAAVAEAKAVVETAAVQNGVKAQTLTVSASWKEKKVYIDKITFMVEGNEQQALAVKNSIEQWINTDVSVSWSQEERNE